MGKITCICWSYSPPEGLLELYFGMHTHASYSFVERYSSPDSLYDPMCQHYLASSTSDITHFDHKTFQMMSYQSWSYCLFPHFALGSGSYACTPHTFPCNSFLTPGFVVDLFDIRKQGSIVVKPFIISQFYECSLICPIVVGFCWKIWIWLGVIFIMSQESFLYFDVKESAFFSTLLITLPDWTC